MILNQSFPGGFVTFCDDIRYEIAAKMTLVGVYQGQMNVFGNSPVVLPQLCALIDFRFTPDSLPIKPKICVFRSDQDEPIFTFETEVPANEETLFEQSSELEEGSVRFHQMILPIQLHGVLINESLRLKVRAFVNNDEVRLGTLQLNLVPPESEPDQQ